MQHNNPIKISILLYFLILGMATSIGAKTVFNYKVKVLSMPVLDLKMQLSSSVKGGQEVKKVEFFAQTNNFFDKIYRVNNYYKCTYDHEKFIPIVRSKKIEQPNLKNEVEIEYTGDEAIYSDGENIEIPKNTYSLLSLIMLLRDEKPDLLNNKEMYIEINKQVFTVRLVNNNKKMLQIGGEKIKTRATEIELNRKYEGKRDREKNTRADIFYGNVTKEKGYRKIWIEDKPPHRIIKAKFSLGGTSLVAILKGVQD